LAKIPPFLFGPERVVGTGNPRCPKGKRAQGKSIKKELKKKGKVKSGKDRREHGNQSQPVDYSRPAY
jgi:hypothetical protein